MNIAGRLSRMETALRRRREDGRIDPATYAEVEREIARIMAEPDTMTKEEAQAVVDDVKRACGLL